MRVDPPQTPASGMALADRERRGGEREGRGAIEAGGGGRGSGREWRSNFFCLLFNSSKTKTKSERKKEETSTPPRSGRLDIAFHQRDTLMATRRDALGAQRGSRRARRARTKGGGARRFFRGGRVLTPFLLLFWKEETLDRSTPNSDRLRRRIAPGNHARTCIGVDASRRGRRRRARRAARAPRGGKAKTRRQEKRRLREKRLADSQGAKVFSICSPRVAGLRKQN